MGRTTLSSGPGSHEEAGRASGKQHSQRSVFPASALVDLLQPPGVIGVWKSNEPFPPQLFFVVVSAVTLTESQLGHVVTRGQVLRSMWECFTH